MKGHGRKPGKGRGNQKKDPKQVLNEHFGANPGLVEEIWKRIESSPYPDLKNFLKQNIHLFSKINDYLNLRLSLQGIEVSDSVKAQQILALFEVITMRAKKGILIPTASLEIGREKVEIDMEELWLQLHKQIKH